MRTFGTFIFLVSIASTLCDVPKDYIGNPNDSHGYKLMYHAKTWTEARDDCANIGAKLAVPKTRDQFEFIQKIVRSMQYQSIVGTEYKLLVWLGISNLKNYQVWANVDGENIEDTEFHTWAGQNGLKSENPAEPHCVGMDSMNFGLRDWWCHQRQPYICEILTVQNATQ
ncbi:C-type lectin lectoxin-Phi1-like [Ostrinia nubilalis]|uniref:C-type lectin lectoxin-Phi1-like n=1 Tax=Ostrinia nubilalis TaxID=29057 RepID=UPI003082282A